MKGRRPSVLLQPTIYFRYSMSYYQCIPLKMIKQMNKISFEMAFGIFKMEFGKCLKLRNVHCFVVAFVDIYMIMQR